MIQVLIDTAPIVICALISIIVYKKLDPRWLRMFTWFLLFTTAFSITGWAYSTYLKKSNHFIFNIYQVTAFWFYFTAFYKAFETKILKQLTVAGAVLFTAFVLFRFLKKDGFFIFNSTVYMLGSVMVIFLCLLYFVSLFKSDVFINYFSIPMFWIATGLLFYFVGNCIYLSFIDYIIHNNLDPNGNIYQIIMVTLNVLLYSLFVIGFLSKQLWKKQT